MIKLTLPVFLSLGKKNKFLSVTFSLVDEEKKTDALSRERRPIPQRSEFFFFFSRKREGKKRTILRNTSTISSKSCDSLDQQPVCA